MWAASGVLGDKAPGLPWVPRVTGCWDSLQVWAVGERFRAGAESILVLRCTSGRRCW